ncbi:MAG: hypothetical protein OXG81_12470 [Acidobacteria bacterium]|nr:hypothetical protein [Acidobacteriota bacterium]MCY3968800.1 hypothetical protein [Acidobacteriota bacterium]
MAWLVVVLAGCVLLDAVAYTVASRRPSAPRGLLAVQSGLKWFNCAGVLLCVGWFWSRLLTGGVSYSGWATAAAGFVTVATVWAVVTFVASGAKPEGRRDGGGRRVLRLAPHYARLAAILFLMAVILGGGPDDSGALLFLMIGLVLSGSLERSTLASLEAPRSVSVVSEDDGE